MKNIIKTDCYFFLLFFTIIMFPFSCIREVKSEDTDEVTEAPVIQNNKIDTPKERQQDNLDCFTEEEMQSLNLLLKAISEKGSTSSLKTKFKFSDEDLKERKDLLSKESFDYFELKHGNIECDSSISLFFF